MVVDARHHPPLTPVRNSVYQPFDGKNSTDFFQFIHQCVQFIGIANVDHHGTDKHSVMGVQRNGTDIGVEFGDNCCELVHDAETVFTDNLDACKKIGLNFPVP